MDLDLCGNVYVSKDLSKFSLKCAKCDENMKLWTGFRQHIKTCWYSEGNIEEDEEPFIELPIELKPDHLDVKRDFVDATFDILDDATPPPMESIKHEDELMNCEIDLDEMVDANKFGSDDNRISFNESGEFIEENASDAVPSSGFENSLKDSNVFEDHVHDESNSSSVGSVKSEKKRISRKDPSKYIISFFKQNKQTPFLLELYKNQPCLWDKNDPNYKDQTAWAAAYASMMEAINKEFDIELTESAVKSLVYRVRMRYGQIQGYVKKGLRSKYRAMVQEYIQMCSFMGEIGEEKDTSMVEDTVLKSKCQVFLKYSKEAIDALIDLYASHPVLHDPNHPDRASNFKRGAALSAIVEVLKRDHDISISADRCSIILRSMREWIYKRGEEKRQGKLLSTEELYYLERCSFFPPKVKKVRHVCSKCEFVALSEKGLQVHLFEAHQIGGMPHQCDECDRAFRQRSSLITHIQRSHSDKTHECEYCHRKFSVLADHRLHIRTHTEEKPYVCELCGKAFRIRSQLGYHTTAIHTKVRAFKCNLCPKDFLKAVHLRDHIKSHLNIRDKICETCGKGFTNCHSLIRHRQIHSAVKKFECKLCDAKFHQFVGLNSHMKRTHNIVKSTPKA